MVSAFVPLPIWRCIIKWNKLRMLSKRCTCFISKVLLCNIIRKFDSRNKLSWRKLHTPLGTSIRKLHKSAFFGKSDRWWDGCQLASPAKSYAVENVFIMRLPCYEIKNESEGEEGDGGERQWIETSAPNMGQQLLCFFISESAHLVLDLISPKEDLLLGFRLAGCWLCYGDP